jgi:hypothetical protein
MWAANHELLFRKELFKLVAEHLGGEANRKKNLDPKVVKISLVTSKRTEKTLQRQPTGGLPFLAFPSNSG